MFDLIENLGSSLDWLIVRFDWLIDWSVDWLIYSLFWSIKQSIESGLIQAPDLKLKMWFFPFLLCSVYFSVLRCRFLLYLWIIFEWLKHISWRGFPLTSQGAKKIDTGNEEALQRRWKEEYQAILHSLDATGFTTKEREELFTTVAAILHLGNVRFEEGGDYAQLANPETVSTVAQVHFCCSCFVDSFLLRRLLHEGLRQVLFQLLGISRDALIQALTHRGVHARQDKVIICLVGRLIDW